jgi:hypothetical protein
VFRLLLRAWESKNKYETSDWILLDGLSLQADDVAAHTGAGGKSRSRKIAPAAFSISLDVYAAQGKPVT